ncbi:MAG TPA: hypothetical protein VFT46_07190 [Holophagaceae bacterium]|nr:hypothetical protein [Holophagaceae bacterium]
MPRKKKLVDLEDAGGSLDWTPDGMDIFIPQELVGDWPAVEMFWDEDADAIIIRRAEP